MVSATGQPGLWRRIVLLDFAPRVKTHLLTLCALLALTMTWGYRLRMFQLLYSSRGVAFGASYSDVTALLAGYWLMVFAMLALAAILVWTIWHSDLKWALTGLAGALILWVVAIGVVPRAVTLFVVRPNELAKEKPYIEKNIKLTRLAYGLDTIQQSRFPVEDSVTAETIAQNQEIVKNIRLWDHRPLRQTYSQIQEIRPYYSFGGVDVDRYAINGEQRQVMLSAREVLTSRLSPTART